MIDTASQRASMWLTRWGALFVLIVLFVLFVLAAATTSIGCSERAAVAPEEPVVAPPSSLAKDLKPLLPTRPGRFAPAHVSAPTGLRGATIAEIDSCASCHPDVFAQQQASAHAWSSFSNPIYRVSVEGLRAAAGKTASRMCAGCHDLALLIDGKMDIEVGPEEPLAHAGVTCRSCHGIKHASADGNGSFALSAEPISLPRTGDPASVLAHKKSVAPLRTDAMCGSCHRGFLSTATGNGHFLPGMDELSGHANSAYSGPGLGLVDSVTPKSCIDCHMAKVPASGAETAAKAGMISSHRFAGGHTWLAAMLGDDAQLRAHRQMLTSAATIDIAGAKVAGTWYLPADDASLEAGQEVVLDVVIRNTSVGHRFPAGVLDAQDTFIVVEATDERGRMLASVGRNHAKRGALKSASTSTHVLRSMIAGVDGALHYERDVHNFAAVVVNHAIAARDAAATRFSFRLPSKHSGPLTVHAQLIHRSRNAKIAKLTCAAASSALGKRWTAANRSIGSITIDGCVPPPATVVASVTVVIGGNGLRSPRSDHQRLYELGMALSHSVSERMGEALKPLKKALVLLGSGPESSRDRAAVMAMLAKVTGRQGRTDVALEWVRKAKTEVGETPALAKIKGDILAGVWRWKAAALAYDEAVAGAPQNPSGWRALAIARGSTGEYAASLVAARAGLALVPRDPDLLRVQALALRSLGAADDVVDRALAAFNQHRRPDRAGDIRLLCAQKDEDCARERLPVHVHPMDQHHR